MMSFRKGDVGKGVLVGKCWGFTEKLGVFGMGGIFDRRLLGFEVGWAVRDVFLVFLVAF